MRGVTLLITAIVILCAFESCVALTISSNYYLDSKFMGASKIPCSDALFPCTSLEQLVDGVKMEYADHAMMDRFEMNVMINGELIGCSNASLNFPFTKTFKMKWTSSKPSEYFTLACPSVFNSQSKLDEFEMSNWYYQGKVASEMSAVPSLSVLTLSNGNTNIGFGKNIFKVAIPSIENVILSSITRLY